MSKDVLSISIIEETLLCVENGSEKCEGFEDD